MTDDERSVRALAQLMGVELNYDPDTYYPIEMHSRTVRMRSGHTKMGLIQFNTVTHPTWASALGSLQSAIAT